MYSDWDPGFRLYVKIGDAVFLYCNGDDRFAIFSIIEDDSSVSYGTILTFREVYRRICNGDVMGLERLEIIG